MTSRKYMGRGAGTSHSRHGAIIIQMIDSTVASCSHEPIILNPPDFAISLFPDKVTKWDKHCGRILDFLRNGISLVTSRLVQTVRMFGILQPSKSV